MKRTQFNFHLLRIDTLHKKIKYLLKYMQPFPKIIQIYGVTELLLGNVDKQETFSRFGRPYPEFNLERTVKHLAKKSRNL